MQKTFITIYDQKKKCISKLNLFILLGVICMVGGLVACNDNTETMQTNSNMQVSEGTMSVSKTTESFRPEETVSITVNSIITTQYAVKEKTSSDGGSSLHVGAIVYKNSIYGFDFLLPESWKGYSIVDDQWSGNDAENQIKTGPEIIIRHPLWTSDNIWQDIPIMVFRLDEWSNVVKGPGQEEGETLFIGAGPNGPTELGRNSKYVFALPFRFDFVADVGIEEVHDILNLNPLQPTEEINVNE